MEDDGLCAAFSPLTLLHKSEPLPRDPAAISRQPQVVAKLQKRTDEDRQWPACRKCRKDRFDEPLEDFVARHKRTKKEGKDKKRGIQLMVTDFFKYTKPIVKLEKKTSADISSNPTAGEKDVLQSQQYNYDKSAVPEDDDIEILEVIPSRETGSKKCEPFVYYVPDSPEEEQLKREPKAEPHSDESPAQHVTLMLPVPENVVKEETIEVTPEPISLEVESACEDGLDESDKPTERESMLMVRVQELSRGLEEMKSVISRKKRIAATETLATKLKKKMLKSKCKRAGTKPIFIVSKKHPTVKPDKKREGTGVLATGNDSTPEKPTDINTEEPQAIIDERKQPDTEFQPLDEESGANVVDQQEEEEPGKNQPTFQILVM